MASKSCTKSYNRKLNNSITSCNIQFDKLFRESNSRPSAAKSAGTVGKWGITSFTSIRSSSISERRSSDIRGTYATKRLKLEYVNQKTHDKDMIPQSKKEHTSDSNKPKKFFKSRNASSNTERTLSTAKFSESVDQDYDKTCSTERLYCKRDKSNAVSSILELPGREETKPPIVLRICKGTAKLICSDEPDTEPYQVSKISTIPEMNNTIGSNTQADHIFRYESRNLSQLPVKFDLRATRNRSKNLKYDVIPNSTSTSNPENSGLSLTLRKSVTDSEETFNSHYDVIKTRSIHGKSNKVDKDLRNSEKSLPKTKYVEQKNELVKENYHDASNQGFGPTDRISARINNEVYNNSYVNAHSDCENVDERNITPLTEIIKINETELVSLGNNAEDKTKNVDNEWSSSSDDSESASNNELNDLRTQNQCLTSRSEPSIMTKNKTTIKPTITKKGSIFKTRSTGAASINKRHALYKHKWSDSEKELKLLNVDSKKVEADILNLTPTSSNLIDYDAEIKNSHLTRITTFSENETNLSHEVESTVTSIRCDKKVKGFYTVVKNVKKAHQIQESGEFQEFNDDVDYIMDTLRDNNPNATRCLSAIRLASKCMAPAFRMHVRAHGTVAKFFKALHDATADQSLALCTATVMFVLSQDRLAMDLDRDCLELMLSLLESDASHKNALNDCGLSHAELLKNREKVRQLCADIQEQGHAQHLNLDNITVGQLAMETLLSLTSKRAGEWFKEELRELGGLEHIIKTITECHRYINSAYQSHHKWSESLLDKLRKVNRCLRVLENVTHMNEENQKYLLQYDDCILVVTIAHLYNFCGLQITEHPCNDENDKISTGAVLRDCLFAVVKLLINLTHRFNKKSFGDETVGRQNHVIGNSLHLILEIPKYLPEEKRFDVMMLALILLINMIEKCDDNKKMLVISKVSANNRDSENGINALINLFYQQEELARLEEQKTDAILDGKKDSEQTETISTTSKSQEEFIEETVAKLLQKAGRHMEHTLIGAYVVLLLGYLIMDSKDYEKMVRQKLPNNSFATMIAVLQKFFNFMNLTASNEISSCGIAATEKVIKFLKISDIRPIEEDPKFGFQNTHKQLENFC